MIKKFQIQINFNYIMIKYDKIYINIENIEKFISIYFTCYLIKFIKKY
jgi:hypothetical protein